MKTNAGYRFPARQGGATLVIALLILVLIMMIGITAISTSNTQYKLAGNLQFEDGALNNAETAIAAGEEWLGVSGNYKTQGLRAGDAYNPSGTTPQLRPAALAANAALTMSWSDSNSLSLPGNANQRYFIELMSTNSKLQGSSQVVGGRTSSGCNQVNTYQITGRGVSGRGATKYVQSYYSVLSCT